MEILSISISSLLYLLFIAIGIFIIIQNPQRKVMRYLSATMICGALYIYCSTLARITTDMTTATLWARILFAPGEIATLLLLLLSLEFSEEFKTGIRVSYKLKIAYVILDILILGLVAFTNLMVDYKNPVYINNKWIVWDYNTNSLFLVRTLFLSMKTLVPVMNFALIFVSRKLTKNKKLIRNIFISSIFLFIGANFSCFHFYFRTKFHDLYVFPEFLQEAFILVGLSILLWTLLSPKMIFSNFLEVVKDFISYIGYSFLLLIPYSFILFVGFSDISSGRFIAVLLAILGLVILTHSTHEWIIELVKESIKKRKFTLPTLLPSEIYFALKYISSPDRLAESSLLKLEQVNRIAKEKAISKVEALRIFLKESIEYFKPESKREKRTLANLKYEILRMIAYEQASESQIMWDLGFDVYTRSVEEKISEDRQPRFPLKDASEYPATSQRSFKRIKKEAIEMLRWKLEEGEN